MAPPDFFPVDSRVVLHGLVKSPELNGKVGVVNSGLASGRQQVLVEGMSKSVALKVSNLKYEGRSVESLSIKELKTILQSNTNITEVALTGIDKSDLQAKVASMKGSSPERIAQWLAEAKTKSPTPPVATPVASPNVDPSQAADQLANMNPDQLRQQARMMRTMNPDTIRRMNPQLAHMTNAQIQQAANQMEMMANNPSMMKMATDQIKKMSPEEIQRMQQGQAMAGTPATGNAAASNTPTTNPSAPSSVADQATKAADMMANMTPEQLKHQADMFESMSPDAIRQMNPQLAHMTDDQIKMAANQFRMMADNPEMMKMAMNQMKSLSPEQIEAIRNGSAPAPDPSQMMGGDPTKMLANMDKGQLKAMLQSLKENPDMLKQFAATSGMNEEQLAKGIEMFGDMDDAKLDLTLNMLQRVQKAKDMWTQADTKAGGHLMKIVVGGALFFVCFFVYWLFFRSSSTSGGSVATDPLTIPDIGTKKAYAEDEFASEF